MIGLPDSFLKQYNEKHSPHTLFGIISSAVSQGADWATALVNWAGRKEITINGAAKTADLDDSTFATGWTANDGSEITVVSEQIDVSHATSGAYQTFTKDLTTVSDSEWILDFDFQITAIAGRTSSSGRFTIGISDTTTNYDASQDGLFCNFALATSLEFIGASPVAEAIDASNDGAFTWTPAVSHYYYRLQRNSTTSYTITLYSDSDRSTVFETKNFVCTATTNGLQYLKVATDNTTDATGEISGKIDNIKFYNAVSVVSNIPAQQTATFSDDFTAVQGTLDTTWVSDSSNVIADATNDNMKVNAVIEASFSECMTDLGTGISETAWVIDFDYDITAWTVYSTGASAVDTYIIMSSITDADSSTGDHLGIKIRTANDNIYPMTGNGTTIAAASAGTAFDLAPSTTGIRYFRYTRLSATQLKLEVFSTSARTGTPTETRLVTISSGYTGIRYFGAMVGNNGSSGDGTLTSTLTNVKFYNNITEVNPSTLTDYPLTVKIQGDADLMEKVTETVDDDFSSDNFTDTGTDVEVTGGQCGGTFTRGATVDGANLPITALSDSKWVTRFKFSLTSFDASTNGVYMALTDIGAATSSNGNRDAIAFWMRYDGGAFYTISHVDGAAFGVTSTNMATTPVAGDVYYVELKRTSTTTGTCSLYADSAYTVLVEAKTFTVAATVVSLDNFAVMNMSDSGGASNLIAHIDDLKIWDGITNPVTQETATRSDDFTDSGATSHTSDNTTVGGWLAQDISYTKVNGSTDVMDIDVQEDGTNDAISYDLGSAMSDSAWVLRFKMNHSARGTNGIFFFGLSDKDSVSGETTAQDVIGMRWDGYGGGTTGRYACLDTNGVGLDIWSTTEGAINSTFTLSTDYFVEIKRTSATAYTVEIFTSSDYTTGSFGVSNGVTTSDVTGLRYIKLVNMMSAHTTHSLQGTIDDVQFYNGVTSI